MRVTWNISTAFAFLRLTFVEVVTNTGRTYTGMSTPVVYRRSQLGWRGRVQVTGCTAGLASSIGSTSIVRQSENEIYIWWHPRSKNPGYAYVHWEILWGVIRSSLHDYIGLHFQSSGAERLVCVNDVAQDEKNEIITTNVWLLQVDNSLMAWYC